jgi:general secretion pathway protein H
MTVRRHIRGFSLIEILVVVVIVAIMASIAMISLGVLGDDRQIRTEARRMMTLLQVAQDDAVMQGREFGIELMTDAYRFVEFDPLTGQWAEVLGDDTLRMRKLPDGVEFDLYIEDKRIPLQREPARIDMSDDNAGRRSTKPYSPHLLIFSSGDSTPFELHLVRRDLDQIVVLEGEPTGQVDIVDDNEV